MTIHERPQQLSLLDALRARDGGMSEGEANAQEAWRAEAREAIRRCALTHRTFIVDQVWDFMPIWSRTHEKRAMGMAMRRAVATGIIKATQEYRPSAQVQCHGNPRRVWRSGL